MFNFSFKKNTNKFISFLIFFYFLQLFFFTFHKSTFADEIISISARVGNDDIISPVGGSVNLPYTAIRFSGFAYPNAKVFLLKDGKEKTQAIADGSGEFSITIPEKYEDTALYTLFVLDLFNNKSLLLNYPIVVYNGYVTHLSGIKFAPTVLVDKSEVNFVDSINVSGFALPNQDMEIVLIKKDSSLNFSLLNNGGKKVFKVTSSSNGAFKMDISVLGFLKGEYSLYVKYKDDLRFSKTINFNVGDFTKFNVSSENIPGDCNFDSVINLVDFSVLAFWYKKQNPPICVDTNKDQIINLIDFSILAFYWTGN